MKKRMFLLIALAALSIPLSTYGNAQIKVKSGLIVGAGSSTLYDTQYKALPDLNDIDYKSPDAAIGYKLRLLPSDKPFFYDVDIIAGIKRFQHWRYPNLFSPSGDWNRLNMSERKYTYFQFTINPSWSYQFIDRWYAGVGLSPTLYMVKGRTTDNRNAGYKFDIPASVKLGYDFKYVDVSFNYYYGFSDIVYSDYITKAKFRNWQVQVFIPF